MPPPPPPPPPDADAVHRAHSDPWDDATTWYERRKLEVLLATLPRERYARAWEPGCGPGLVSRSLARRVDDLVASDCSQQAITLARQCPDNGGHVSFVRSELPEVPPLTGSVDLLVVVELLYYVPDLRACLDALWSACAPGAHAVFLHSAHRPHDAYRGGPQTHAAILLDNPRRSAVKAVSHCDQDFLLDVYETQA